MNSKQIEQRLFKHYKAYEYHLAGVYIYSWESDFFCISTSGYTYETEIKVSRSDFKADFKKLGPEFGDLSAKVIAHLSMTSAETIMSHIEKEGQYEFTDSGAKLAVKREHIIVEKQAPEGYAYVSSSKGDIFVHGVLDAELEAEGFSRELTRRIQSLRKKSGLQKTDNIDLYVHAGKELVNMFKKHSVMIAGKVGAPDLKISELAPGKNFEHKDQFKVRGKEMSIFFNKV